MTKVAAIQMVSTDDVASNLRAAEKLIGAAAAQHAEFLVLPENFPLMGMQEQDKVGILESFGKGPIQSFLSDQAQLHRVWILGGRPTTVGYPGVPRGLPSTLDISSDLM